MPEKFTAPLRQNKRLGQIFLKSEAAIVKILNSVDLGKQDIVLEIGGGDGRISTKIATKVFHLYVIEFDSRFIPLLKKKLADFDNVTIMHGDILSPQILQSISAEVKGRKIRVYGSIPYHITGKIIRFLLANLARIEQASLLIQKEVARRVVSSPGTKEYGLLSVLVQHVAKVSLGPLIERNSFKPVPKVDSQILHIIPDTTSDLSIERGFAKMATTLFQNRRKQICNSLAKYLGKKLSEGLKRRISEGGFTLTARPEQLSPGQLFDLYEIVSEFEKNIPD